MDLPKKIVQGRTSQSETVPDNQKRIVVNRYRVEKKLGSGNFGTAYLVKDLKTTNPEDGLKVLKQIPCGDLQPDETVDAMHEAKLLSKLHHPGIVKFYDSFVDGEFFCIVTEYCEGGDLDDYIAKMRKRGQSIKEKQVMEWAAQLLSAVHYMHSRRVLHRDLKARNIFLRQNCTKIGDFGISRILMGTADMATTFTGTPYYMSPEVLKHEGYNSKSDVWSIGCILFELCCQRHAFEGQGLMGVMFKIVEGDCPQVGERYSAKLQDLLTTIFIKDPTNRPAASELLQNAYIRKYCESKSEADGQAAEQEAQAIELTLQKKWHRKDLEDDKWKHLNPRERMRLKKQEEADRKGRELAEAAKINSQNNMMRKQHLQEMKHQKEPAPWTDTMRRERTFALPEEATLKPTFTSRPKTAPMFMEQVPSDEEEDNELTVVSHLTASAVPTQANMTYVLHPSQSKTLASSLNLDDRPITPMKNRMVYDVKHSTLDFKDGVPDDPKLADTYYSQFEEEFVEDKDDSPKQKSSSDGYSSTDHDGSFEVTDDGVGESNDNDEESDGEDEGTLAAGSHDEYALIHHMQTQLNVTHGNSSGSDDEDTNEDTVMLADDTVAGAFGPSARLIKMQKLKETAESKLGPETFKKAYEFLKKARYKDAGATSTVDEEHILAQLRKITPHVSDCFFIDQLLFLEMQANIEEHYG